MNNKLECITCRVGMEPLEEKENTKSLKCNKCNSIMKVTFDTDGKTLLEVEWVKGA